MVRAGPSCDAISSVASGPCQCDQGPTLLSARNIPEFPDEPKFGMSSLSTGHAAAAAQLLLVASEAVGEGLDQLTLREALAPMLGNPALAIVRAGELSVYGGRRVRVVAEVDGE